MKVSDSYPSIVQGVSQQAPETRGPGRMTEQVNMIPDPVYGVTRRHGTVFLSDQDLGSAHPVQAAIDDTATWRVLPYSNGVSDIDLAYRTAAAGSSTLPPVMAFDRTTNTFLDYRRNVADVALDVLTSNGVSAITALGKYVFAASNSSTAAATTTELWDTAPNNERASVWIRGGAYSRTFKIDVTNTSGVTTSYSYTTPSASYPGVLDTSAIPQFSSNIAGTDTEEELVYVRRKDMTPPWGSGTHVWRTDLTWGQWTPVITSAHQFDRSSGSVVDTTLTNSYPSAPGTSQYYWATGDRFVYFNTATWDAVTDQTDIWNIVTYTHDKVQANPNYTRAVTDLTSEYNTAVTQWLATSAEAIQPENIAEALRVLIATAYTVIRAGSHLLISGAKAVAVSDSGDGTFIRGVANTVKSIADLVDVHWPGKVVRVQAQNSAESFYLRADAVGLTPVEVRWVEGTSETKHITSGLIYLLVDSGHIYAASSAALLNTLVAGDHPEWVDSIVGDGDSDPMPPFIGAQISYLGVFQDRLLVGSRGTLTASATGDYLNFFRSTVVTVPAKDAYSMRAEGPNDDVLHFSVVYNKDLILFGERRQYAVSGKSPMAPTSANIPVMSNHADAALVPPIEVGGLVFYASTNNTTSSVSQIEPTVNIDSPASFPISSQLDNYLTGRIAEFIASSKPLALFCRTTGNRQALFSFQYVDAVQGRRQDAWYKWEFNPALGSIVGVSHKNNKMVIYFLREDAGKLWWVADEADLLGGLSARPYFDSARLYSSIGISTHTLSTVPGYPWNVAFDSSTLYYLQGRRDANNAAALLTDFPLAPANARWVGCEFGAYFVPTNPKVKDKNDNAVTTGVITVTTVGVVVRSSSGLTYTVSAKNGTVSYSLNGRILGDTMVGRVPVTTGEYDLTVCQDSTQYTLTIAANTWLPLTVSSMNWVGQVFNRTMRV
jgi:hypothetical protein